MNDKIPPVHWARSHFTCRANSDCLLNNMCEVFNSKLEHGRDKPTITYLEYIRVYLMKRHCIVQKEIDKCKMTSMMFDQYVVNLKEETCSCRYWEITRIICRHGFCAIWEHIQNGEKAQQPEYWVGRPKKKRRRAIDEPTNQSTNLPRKFLTVTYSKCHNKGHSSRTCKGQGGQVR
uniref:SWIM-type domain-containing protein n=1 Tax=Lactuca sativa TaxID=4236 RepID=A0A9R1XAS9_LACSA|nr:hypothetical protein LSAT_V11C600325100 [Lactuca sativa]